jgi:glycerophosphoryl diester phosphodiesterase
MRSFLYSNIARLIDEKVSEKYAAEIGAYFEKVDKEYIKKAHRHGLAVHLFTVNTDEEIQHAIEIGADGVFTDYPRKRPDTY